MSRRMNGEGSIRRRADGRWELRVMLGYRDDGKPSYKSLYGRTRTEVLAKLEAFRKEQNCGLDMSHRYTFNEWSSIWYEHHKSSISPVTAEHYKYILNRLQAWFGDRYIAEIKPFDIEVFLKSLRSESLSDSYISSSRGMLFQIFHKAEANNLVVKNVIALADKMRSSGPKKRKEAFTADEVKIMMTQLPYDKIGHSIRLMLGTGIRLQELLALEPHLIEKDGSVIHVRQAIKLVKGTVHIGDPKSPDSYRDVPVPPNLRWCAMELSKVNTKFIFEKRKKDTPCNPTYYRDEFRKALSKLEGVRLLTPHSCRHTYVSQMHALGVNICTIQNIVGHADVDMTQHYLHVQDSVRQEAIIKFAEAFPVNTPSPDDPEEGTRMIIPFPEVI